MPEGVSVSADGLAVSHVGTGYVWSGALVEPAVSSAERCYAEWAIEEADGDCFVMVGVTDLDAALPPGQATGMFSSPGSRMYYCHDSQAYPGGRDWGAAGRRARGDRVGLLVERGGVSVYVNGARLGPGPMATDLPPRVRAAGFARAHGHRSDRTRPRKSRTPFRVKRGQCVPIQPSPLLNVHKSTVASLSLQIC